MRKLMRIFMGAAMLALPMMLTSCEGTLDDVLGKWDRPTNNNGEKDGTESEIAKKIVTFDAILADGSSFDVSFKLNGKDVSVNFKKENGKYTVSSTTLKAENFKLAQVEGKDLLELTVLTDDGKVQGQIFFNTKDGSYYILNNIGYDVTFDGNVLVDNFPLSVTNLCPDKAVIEIDTNKDDTAYEKSLIVYYNKSKEDIWKTVVDRYDLSSVLKGVLKLQMGEDDPYDPATDALDSTRVYVYDGSIGYEVVGSDSDDPAIGINKVGIKAGADYTDSYKASLIPIVSVAPIG